MIGVCLLWAVVYNNVCIYDCVVGRVISDLYVIYNKERVLTLVTVL